MNLRAIRFLTVALVLIGLLLAYPTLSQAKYVLKAGSSWEESLLWNDPLRIFAKMIQERSNGEIEIKFIGGSETFPVFEGVELLRRGVIDILCTVGPFYTPKLPEVFVSNLTELTPWEERKVGYYQAMNKLHKEKLNAVYLGRFANSQIIFVFEKKVAKPDFSGLKIRGLPIYNHIIVALNGSPIKVAPAELYTALDKGIVDGYGFPELGHIERKFYEVAPFHIDHPVHRVPLTLLMNLDTFKKLTKRLQKMVMEVATEAEIVAVKQHDAAVAAERAKLAKLGVTFIKWDPQEAKKFTQTAKRTGAEVAKKLAPENAPKLLEMVIKE